jgi:vesicular inhibitory amino acid transporter
LSYLLIKNCLVTPSNGQRDHHATGSSFGAYVNIVCVTAGIGILGLPASVAGSGWLSIAFIVFAGLVSVFNGRLLVECLYKDDGTRLETFPDIGERAFGRFGKYFVRFAHYSMILGSGCILLILLSTNLYELCLDYGVYLDKKIWVVISAAFIGLPYLIFKNMKELIYLGIFGVLTTVFAVIVVIIVGAQKLAVEVAPQTEAVIWSGIPLALSTFSLAYAGNVVYPHVEGSMRHPKQWTRVLIAAIATITSLYVIMAAFGYAVFGTDVHSPILKNLPPKGALKIAATISINVHIIMAAPILLCAFGNEMESNLNISTATMSKTKELLCRLGTRFATIAFVTILSVFLPYFQQFVSLVGAVSSSLTLFFFPVLCHLKIFGIKGRPIWTYILMFIILAVGVLSFVLGTIDSIKDFIKAVDADKNGTA